MYYISIFFIVVLSTTIGLVANSIVKRNNFSYSMLLIMPKAEVIANLKSKSSCIKISKTLEKLDNQQIFNLYQKFEEAYSYSREKRLPSFIEVKCFRWLEHVGVSDDWELGYRKKSELKEWIECDLINNPQIVSQDLKFVENSTDPSYRKRSFVYDFLSSMRQKINDPLGKRKKN